MKDNQKHQIIERESQPNNWINDNLRIDHFQKITSKIMFQRIIKQLRNRQSIIIKCSQQQRIDFCLMRTITLIISLKYIQLKTISVIMIILIISTIIILNIKIISIIEQAQFENQKSKQEYFQRQKIQFINSSNKDNINNISNKKELQAEINRFEYSESCGRSRNKKSIRKACKNLLKVFYKKRKVHSQQQRQLEEQQEGYRPSSIKKEQQQQQKQKEFMKDQPKKKQLEESLKIRKRRTGNKRGIIIFGECNRKFY